MEYTLDSFLEKQDITKLRFLAYLMTLKDIKTTKSKYLQILKKCLINSKIYNNYTSLYSTLPEETKKAFLLYQSDEGYTIINNLLRKGTILTQDYVQNKLIKSKMPEVSKVFLKPFDFKRFNTQKVEEELRNIHKSIAEASATDTKETTSTINKILNAMNKFVLFEDLMVFRGVSMSSSHKHPLEQKVIQNKDMYSKKIRTLKKNEIYTEKAFTSCSFIGSVSANFSRGNCCLFRYVLQKGTPCFIYPLHTSSEYREFEILLPPLKYKVISIHDIKTPAGLYRVYDVKPVSFETKLLA